MGASRRRVSLGVVAGACLLAAPAAASAASTDVSISASLKTLTVQAASSTTNHVVVSADVPAGKVLIMDSAGIATNDAPCTVPSPGTIACPLSELTKIQVNLGSGDDSASVTTAVPAKIPTGLDGGSGTDTLLGGNGADAISGSDGNDFMDGGAGPDSFSGGSGLDTVSYRDRTAPVAVSIGGHSRLDGGDIDGAPGARDTVNGDIENELGGSGGDFLVGDSDANSLIGGDGDAFIVGQSGGDYLAGGNGNDFLVGNSGNDVLDGGAGIDGLRGNRDFDRLFAADGERDASIKCGPGRDRVFRDAIDPHPKSCSPHRHRRHHHRH